MDFWSDDDRPRRQSWDRQSYGTIGLLGDMTRFSRLRNLYAPIVMLLGHSYRPELRLSDTLPTSLRKFSCQNDLCYEWFFTWQPQQVTEQLAAIIKTPRRHLEMLSTHSHATRRLWEVNDRHDIPALCLAEGIAYSYSESYYEGRRDRLWYGDDDSPESE